MLKEWLVLHRRNFWLHSSVPLAMSTADQVAVGGAAHDRPAFSATPRWWATARHPCRSSCEVQASRQVVCIDRDDGLSMSGTSDLVDSSYRLLWVRRVGAVDEGGTQLGRRWRA